MLALDDRAWRRSSRALTPRARKSRKRATQLFCEIRCPMFLKMDVSSQSADTIKLIFIPCVLTGIRASGIKRI
jgi:hypothetical protein